MIDSKLTEHILYRTVFLAIVVAGFAGVAATAESEMKLALPFSDHMVLQRGLPVPVWGTSRPGEAVTVEFAGQTHSTSAGADGQWSVTLAPLDTCAEGRVLTVRGKTTLTLKDVLIGDVWLCAGQSNMQASMERLKTSNAGPQLRALAADRYDRGLDVTTPFVRVLRVGTNKLDGRKNRWMECGPEALKNDSASPGFSAVGALFGRELNAELKIPIGMIEAAVGGTRIETWTPPAAYTTLPAFKAEAAASPLKIDGVEPGHNYRALISPIVPTAIRGVLWYQGESNLIDCPEGSRYADKMEALIQGWRSVWKRPDLPVYFVQLPRHAYTKRKPDTITLASLAFFREGQSLALRLPHTGMAVTTDLVDVVGEIHPPNKWDIAHRLVLLALAGTYGRDIVYTGPIYKGMEVRDAKIVIRFDHVGGGLVNGGGVPLSCFTISGVDRIFVPACAAIDGDTVVVSSAAVPQPVAVRFCWSESDAPNLFNKEGLPAAPFRTDEWPPMQPMP